MTASRTAGDVQVNASGPQAGLTFVTDPRRTLAIGIPVAAALALLGLLGQFLVLGLGLDAWAPTFFAGKMDVSEELTVPTWFSGVLLAGGAAAAWTAGSVSRARGRSDVWGWRLLAVAFTYISLDELVALHEEAGIALRRVFDLSGVLYFAWFLVAVPVLAVFALIMIPFLRRLPRATTTGILVAGLVYVGGAVGMEMVGSLIADTRGEDTMLFAASSAFEEFLEMLGSLLFLATVSRFSLEHVRRGDVGAAAAGPVAAGESRAG